MNRKTLLRSAGLALLLALLLAWWWWPSAESIELAEVRMAPLTESIDEDAAVRAHDRYLITAPVAGRARRIEAHAGDRVQAGVVLALLDPLPLAPREREEAAARLEAAHARAAQAEKQTAALTARLELANREAERLTRAGVDAAVARQALDAARAEAAALLRERDAARFAERAASFEAEAIEAVLHRDASSTEPVALRAPVASTVLRVAERSERVVAAGAELLLLGDPQTMEVVIDLLSSDAVRVRPGMQVELHDWGGQAVLAAQVRTVEPSAYVKISPLGVEERRVDVIADLPDPPPELGDGYQVEARVVLWRGDALQIPSTAVFRAGERWSVFAVEDGHARQRVVELGHRGRDAVQVLDGLDAGARVIRYPGDRIREGLRVRDAD